MHLKNVLPKILVVTNNDVEGTYSLGVLDNNSAAVLAGILALRDTSTLDTIEAKLPIDSLMPARVTIDDPHAHIHDGESFTAEHNNSGGSGTKATITFKTPDIARRIHLLVTMRSNVESIYTLGEDATVTGASGSDYVPRNRDRENATVTTLISEGSTGGAGCLTLGATVTNFGTVLETLHIGQGKQGGESRDIREWILARNKIYALEVESEAASSEVTIEIHYHEH